MLLLAFSPARADIAQAIGYLAAQQNADGSYGGSPSAIATPVQGTSEALRAFQVTNTAVPPYVPALTYLNANTENSTESLARKAIVNASHGGDVSALLGELLLRQDPFTGGFGDIDSVPNVLDTAFALQALAASGYGNSSEVAGAVGYLLSQQRPNGGWSIERNDSSVYLTALAVRGLSVFKSMYVGTAAALTSAQSFLLAQASAGAWFAEPYLAAQAILSLVPIVSDLSLLDVHVETLRLAQSGDGSWAQDPYTTALAVQAMQAYEIRKGGAVALSASISGYVVKAGSSEPIAGATVSIVELSGTQVTANADGYFIFSGVPAGTYTVTAMKSGYSATSVVANGQAGRLSLAGTIALNVATTTGIVRGRIVDARSLLPVAGAQISLVGNATYSANTDSVGNFEIATVEAGNYAVSVDKAGYNSVTGSASIVAGQVLAVNQNLMPAGGYLDDQPGTITGTAVDAKTGQPIAGALFDLGGGFSAFTDAAGKFSITNVPRASYSGSITASGFQGYSVTLIFAAGCSGNIGTLSLYPLTANTAPTTLTLLGTVVDGVTGAGIVGAQVTLVETGAATMTDVNGRFTFADISTLNFQLAFTATGYKSQTVQMQASGYGESSARIALSPPGTGAATTNLQGVVKDSATGAAIAGATIRIAGRDTAAVSGADGAYSLTDITELNFQLVVSAVGYAEASRDLQLSEHGSYTLNPELQAYAADSFQVVSAAPEQATYVGGAVAMFRAQVANLLADPRSALVLGEVVGADGTPVAAVTPYTPGTTTPVSEFPFAPTESKELQIAWPTAQFAPGRYRLALRVVEPGTITRENLTGLVLAEAATYVEVTQSQAISGALAIDPPITQAGLPTPVALSALVRNAGNIPLASGTYLLTVQSENGEVLHSAQGTTDSLGVGQNADVSFGEWVPTAAGNLTARVVAAASGVAGEISGPLYVGDKASGTFTLDKTVVPEGTQTVRGKIHMQGVDTTKGGSTDPLYKLVQDAVKRGGQYTASGAVNWHRSNRCLGCHIQTQSLMGLASSLDKADINKAATIFLLNSITSSQQTNGALRISHPEFSKTQTTLAAWSLTSWPASDQTFRTEYKAAQYLFNTKYRSGDQTYWTPDHASGWWNHYVSHTALAIQSFARVLRQAEAIDPALVKDYVLAPGKGLGSVNNPLDMEVAPDGSMLVVKHDGAINRIDLETGVTATVASGLPNLRYGLAVLPDGTMFVSGWQSIIKINPDGTRQTVKTTSRYFTDVELGPDGYLYVADHDNQRILRMDVNGNSEVFAAGGLLNYPYGLAFDREGNLLVANLNGYNVLKITPARAVSALADGLAYRPLWLDAMPDGDVYVTSYQLDGLYRIRPNGATERMIWANYLRGVVVKDGHLFVGHQTNNQLHEVQFPVFDRSALASFEAEIPRGARYLLASHRDNNNDNTVHALRLIGLSEARPWITDTALLSQLETATAYIDGVLRARQRSNGGWSRYQSNGGTDALVTAMVGIALDYNNPSPDDPLVRKTIQHLLNTQLADGSYGNYDNGLSTRLAATSFVMAYLPKALERLGGIDIDLHVTTPPTVALSNPSISPTSSATQPDGSIAYVWRLLGVTSNGRDVDFDLALANMQLGETRAVASSTYLEFDNSFVTEKVRLDLAIPSVQALSGMALSVGTNKFDYQANEDVAITSVVTNTGPTIASGQVALAIRAKGSTDLLAQLAPLAVTNLGTGAQVSLPAIWSTGSTLVGEYEVYGRLLDDQSRVVSEGVAPFRISAPGIAVTTGVTTDKPIYDAWDTVFIDGRVQNVSANNILKPGLVEITVLSPTGEVIYFDTRPVREMIPGAITDLPFTLPLSDALAGTYPVQLALKDDFTRVLLSTSSTSFQVQRRAVQALAGTVSVQSPWVYVGDPNACNEVAKNISSTALMSVKLVHQFLDVTNGLVLDEAIEIADVLPGGSIRSYFRNVDTSSLAPSGYACVIKAEIGGAERVLAYGGFEVKEVPIKMASTLTRGAKGRLLVLLDGGRKPDDGTCTGITGVGMELPFASSLSATATAEVRVRDAAGVLLETESVALADFLLTVNASPAQAGSDLTITDFTASHLVAKLTATDPMLGTDYAFEAVIQDGGVSTTFTSTPVHTGCAQSIAERQWHGDFVIHELDLVEPLLPPQDRDPHGPDGAPGLDAQRAYLETLLTNAGWSYTIAVTAEDFTREMRTGAYNIYASFAEHEKLSVEAQKELREAVFRGEGLLLTGPHDSRHHHLIETLGVKYRGKVSFADGVGFIDDTFGVIGGTGIIPGDVALRIERITAQSVAQFLMVYDDTEHLCAGDDQYEASKLGKPSIGADLCATVMDAVTLNAYGQGRTVYAGFDLLATATLQGYDGVLAKALLAALNYVNPPIADNTVGRVAPITLTVTNQGIATPIRATVALPTGLQVVDPRGGTVAGDTVAWEGELAIDEVKTFTVYVRLPETAGTITFQAKVEAPKAGVYTVITESTVTLAVDAAPDPDVLMAQLSVLQGAGLPEDRYLKQAQTYIGNARDLVAAQSFDHALWEAIKAADALAGASSAEVMPVRVGLGHWIAWIERRVP